MQAARGSREVLLSETRQRWTRRGAPRHTQWQSDGRDPQLDGNKPVTGSFWRRGGGENLRALDSITSVCGGQAETELTVTSLLYRAQVAAGAAEEYLQALNSIASLSAAGAGQAAADAEYFCNVLSALGVQLPPALGTWQVRLIWTNLVPGRLLLLHLYCVPLGLQLPPALGTWRVSAVALPLPL